MKNRFSVNEEEKNRIKNLHNIEVINEQWVEVELNEQPEMKDDGSDSLDKFTKQQEVGEQTRNLDRVKSTSTDSESHEKFMTTLCGMDIVAMGDKAVGCRGKKCDGNKTDDSGGCYEPLIKLVKEFCKTKGN